MIHSPIRFCLYCGAPEAVRIGECSVCKDPVCVKCGNIQHIQGKCCPIHDKCLSESSDSFSMIKFIK